MGADRNKQERTSRDGNLTGSQQDMRRPSKTDRKTKIARHDK